MKFRIFAPSLFAFIAFAQEADTPKPDAVVATVDGRKVTYGELEEFFNGLGPDAKKSAFANRKQMIEQYALSLRLLDYAAKEKLEEKSPAKEQLASARRQILALAAINDKLLNVLVTPEDQKQYYENNKDRYTQAKVQVIYIGFVTDPAAASKENPGKKYRTEEEAKAKVEEIRKQIKSRENFIRLVKEYSEDEASKDHDGEFGLVRKSDNIPAEIKQVIFSLKTGEVSGPVLQRNGYYLFRIDAFTVEDYAAVKDNIYSELKTQRAQAWIEEQRQRPVQIEDKAFFADKPAKP